MPTRTSVLPGPAADLLRTLRAVDALTRLLADPSGHADHLVDGALAVVAQALGATAVVLAPGTSGSEPRVPVPRPRAADRTGSVEVPDLVQHATAVAAGCPPRGRALRVGELGSWLLVVPLSQGGHVAAAVPLSAGGEDTHLAVLGTLARLLAVGLRTRALLAAGEGSALDGRPSRPRGAAGGGGTVAFTSREGEVVRLLAHGLSNRQIGERLYIGETTVKFHVHNVMVKLDVRRRAEVVYRSGQLGLLAI